MGSISVNNPLMRCDDEVVAVDGGCEDWFDGWSVVIWEVIGELVLIVVELLLNCC